LPTPALGERSWKNLARNRQIWQNLLRIRLKEGCFTNDDDDIFIVYKTKGRTAYKLTHCGLHTSIDVFPFKPRKTGHVI
jgi:hypothetical protein